MQQNDKLTVVVEDSGQGFELSSIKKGFGLFSLKERIENLKGGFEIEKTPATGTKITFSLPVSQLKLLLNQPPAFS